MAHLFEVALDRPVGKQRGTGDEYAAEIEAVEDGRVAGTPGCIRDKGDTRGKLQQQTEGARQSPALLRTDPIRSRALERPCGRSPAAVER